MREPVKVDPFSNLPLNVQTPPIHLKILLQINIFFSHGEIFSMRYIDGFIHVLQEKPLQFMVININTSEWGCFSLRWCSSKANI